MQWMHMTASAAILHQLGRGEDSKVQLKRLTDRGIEDNNFVQQADVYAQLGDTQKAIESLHTAISYGDPGFTQLLIDPFLDPIREEPEFKRILVEVGFDLGSE